MRALDRTLDLVAALFISVGAALFFIGRHALDSIAAGTYKLPSGVTWVAQTEHHDLQTTLGMRLAMAGVLVAFISAASHWWFGRRARTASPQATPAVER